MSKVEISREKIIAILESKAPKSLTEIYRHLGSGDKLSGSVASKMRTLVEGIDNLVANNKADAGTVKSKPAPKAGSTIQKKTPKKPAKDSAKTNIPRNSRNPFRPNSGYSLILDIISSAKNGIGKEDLLKAYCKASGKDLAHAKFDLAVINSASENSDKRHRSCRDGFTILREGDNYRIRFD